MSGGLKWTEDSVLKRWMCNVSEWMLKIVYWRGKCVRHESGMWMKGIVLKKWMCNVLPNECEWKAVYWRGECAMCHLVKGGQCTEEVNVQCTRVNVNVQNNWKDMQIKHIQSQKYTPGPI